MKIKIYQSNLSVVEIYTKELLDVAKDYGADEYLSNGENTLESEIGSLVSELYNRNYRKAYKQ